MKPVDQRYYTGPMTPMGDCLRACVASIFELELEEVPHFVERGRVYWNDPARGQGQLYAWAADYGLALNTVTYEDAAARRALEFPSPRNFHPGFWIASVTSRDPATLAEGKSSHAIVMWADEVRHDPNPLSRACKQPYRFRGERWFEAYDPSALLRAVSERQTTEVAAGG